MNDVHVQLGEKSIEVVPVFGLPLAAKPFCGVVFGGDLGSANSSGVAHRGFFTRVVARQTTALFS